MPIPISEVLTDMRKLFEDRDRQFDEKDVGAMISICTILGSAALKMETENRIMRRRLAFAFDLDALRSELERSGSNVTLFLVVRREGRVA